MKKQRKENIKAIIVLLVILAIIFFVTALLIHIRIQCSDIVWQWIVCASIISFASFFILLIWLVELLPRNRNSKK